MTAARFGKMACIILVFTFCSVVLLLTGCWDRTEVNDLALITAAAIDKKNEKMIELSVQVFIPRAAGGGQQGLESGGGGGQGGQTLVRSAKGVSISDAMARLQEKLPRLIFWGHCEIFIFGRKLAEKGIRSSVDFMMRHPEVREGAFIFVSAKNAKDALELAPPIERSSSEVLRELAKSKSLLSVALKDLMQQMVGDSKAVGLPWIELLPPEKDKPKNQTIPYISGTAVFKKDKLVGHINDKLTRGVLWLRNEIKLSIITIKPEGTSGFISMKMLRAETKLIPTIKNGKWKITLKAKTEDDVIQNGSNQDLMSPDITKALGRMAAADVKIRVRQALNQVQKKMNADIFGFASAFHRKYPKEWNKMKTHWDEIFPEVTVDFDIEAKVRRPGMSTLPAGVPEEEVEHK